MAAANLTVGTRAKVTAAFTNTAGAAANPTTVVAQVRDPSGEITTYTYGTDSQPTRTSTGVYVLEFDLDTEGQWQVRFAGTGAVVAAQETGIVVPASEFV